MKEKLSRVLAWFDEYFLFVAATFLVFFIPLMPKIPLADILPGYIVRLRSEDLIVFVLFVIYLIQIWRGKVDWKMPTWQLIAGYVAVGAMSILSGLLLLKTIPFEVPAGASWGLGLLLSSGVHIMKAMLHWARYIEYFFLAFLFFSSITSKLKLQIVCVAMLGAVAGIVIYGWGQKYMYWPVFSTMNREFSKGVPLVLTPHARVQSTFGGHYDFAAYLVLLLPFTLVMAFSSRRLWSKFGRTAQVLTWLIHFMGVWGLIISAARTSIISYLAATLVVFTLSIALSSRSLKRKVGAWFGHQFAYFLVVGFLVFGWGGDMIERFEHTLDSIQWVHDTYHTANKWRKEFPYLLGWKEWEQPEGTIAVVVDDFGNNSVLTPTDTQPAPRPATGTAPVETKPADVYEDIPDLKTGYDASGNAYLYEATRTWSVNAEKYGLSMAIRFDVLWPNAIKGFSRNPLLGSSYGTLTKGDNLSVFTEADSTDCNYLRTLGETGILGFACFYGALVVAMWRAWQRRTSQDAWEQMVNVSFLGAMVGILVNALYIDVFAASKVAFTIWMIVGIFWATNKIIGKSAKLAKNETNSDQ